MKVMFVVQGEGRGHMTQALALKELYEECGHEICCVVLGHTKKKGQIPDFFRNAFTCKVVETASPNFCYDKTGGVSIPKTITKTISSFPRFFITYYRLNKLIKKHNPDVVINFYEPMFGIYRFLGGKCKQSYAIGHQFMFLHPDYVANQLSEKFLPRYFVSLFTTLIGWKSKKVALSITEETDHDDITVVPPILRKKVFEGETTKEDFTLVYFLGAGHRVNFLLATSPTWGNQKFEIFTEKFWKTDEDTLQLTGPKGGITFNKLDGEKFLAYMKRAKAVVCTAGFETASEAAYLGKSVLVVPTENHVEQYFNAYDFWFTGLAQMGTSFTDIMKIGNTDFSHQHDIEKFREWVDSYKERFKKALNI